MHESVARATILSEQHLLRPQSHRVSLQTTNSFPNLTVTDECLAKCDSQTGCVAMTFDTTVCTKNCYLFSSLESLQSTPNPTSDSASFACGPLTGSDPLTCDSTLTGSDSRPYQVQCGLAYTGSSSIAPETASSYEECFNKCDTNSACGAFTFDSSVCSNNCQLLAFTDDLSSLTPSETASSGFTPGTARDFNCGSSICGTAVYGGGQINIGYLVACR